MKGFDFRTLDRRTIIQGAAAAGILQVASPFIIQARGETPVRIGMIDPLTGVYAAPAGNEVMGAKLAVEQMNAGGGMLGRQVELLVEDSANDVGTGVQKARKLLERDQVASCNMHIHSACYRIENDSAPRLAAGSPQSACAL